MKKKIYILLFLALFCGFLSLTFQSCKKDTVCKAVITVNDTAGLPVIGATVRLYNDYPRSIVNVTQTTSDIGEADFSFNLEAILFLTVAKTTTDSVAAGFVQLKPGQTVSQVVVYRHL